MMHYYLVMRLMRWNDLEIEGLSWPIAGMRGKVEKTSAGDGDPPCGYLPVFDTREAAEAWSEGGKYSISMVADVTDLVLADR